MVRDAYDVLMGESGKPIEDAEWLETIRRMARLFVDQSEYLSPSRIAKSSLILGSASPRWRISPENAMLNLPSSTYSHLYGWVLHTTGVVEDDTAARIASLVLTERGKFYLMKARAVSVRVQVGLITGIVSELEVTHVTPEVLPNALELSLEEVYRLLEQKHQSLIDRIKANLRELEKGAKVFANQSFLISQRQR